MNTQRLLAIIFIVAGAHGLAYGGFSYTRESTALKLSRSESSCWSASGTNSNAISSNAETSCRVRLDGTTS